MQGDDQIQHRAPILPTDMETLEQVTAQRDLLERQLRRVKDALILKIQENQELGRLLEGAGNGGGGGQNNLLEYQQQNMQINRLRQALAVALTHNNNNQGGVASRIFVNNNQQGDDRALREANQ